MATDPAPFVPRRQPIDPSIGPHSLARYIRRHVLNTNPVTPEQVSRATAMGMIPRSELEHYTYYIGVSRQADIALWRAEEGCFFHLRTKFGNTYTESIHHPEDDDGFDFFVPTGRVLLDGITGLLAAGDPVKIVEREFKKDQSE